MKPQIGALLTLAASLLAACDSTVATSPAQIPASPTSAAAAAAQKPAPQMPAVLNQSSPTATFTPQPSPTAKPSPTATPDPWQHVAWTYATGGAVWGAAAVYDDTVFIGSDDGSLYALSSESGEKRWSFATGGAVRSQPAVDPDAGCVYFSSDDGYLYAAGAQDGEPLWQTEIGNLTEPSVREAIGASTNPTGYDYLQSSPVLSGGKVYIGSADGRILALQASSGEVVWAYQTGDKVRATPLVVDGAVYVGSWDKSMVALDAETGALRWQTPIGGQVQTTAAVYGSLVISASRKASVVALDIETGALVWEFVYGTNMWVESSPVVVGETVYIGSSGNQVVYGLDGQTGKLRLMYNTRAFCWSRPLVIDSTLVIGCTNANNPRQGLDVYQIGPHPTRADLSVLTPLWQLPVGESQPVSGFWAGVASSPVAAGQRIYFGGLDGVVYAVTL